MELVVGLIEKMATPREGQQQSFVFEVPQNVTSCAKPHTKDLQFE